MIQVSKRGPRIKGLTLHYAARTLPLSSSRPLVTLTLSEPQFSYLSSRTTSAASQICHQSLCPGRGDIS